MGDLQRAVGTAVHRLLGADHFAAAQGLLHVGLDGRVEAADLATPTGEQHAVLQAVLEFRVEGGDQLTEAFHDRRHHGTAGFAHAFGDVELGRLALHRKLHHDALDVVFDGREALFDGLQHLLGVLGIGERLLQLLGQRLVDEVAAAGQGDLVGVLRHGAVHPAQVDRTGTDVDHQHVLEHVEAIGHRERLRAQHHGVHGLARGLQDRVFVVDRGLGRHADHRVDQLVLAGTGQTHGFLHKVLGSAQALGILTVFVEREHTVLERAVEVEGKTLLAGFLAEENVLLEQLASDRILGVAHEGLDRFTDTV
ncbi:MAG: hypothetical protein R3E96_05070 [Planctomycetota bacterium]